MRSSSLVFVGAVALSIFASLAWCVPTRLAAADAAHPVVPGFERWTGDAASGGRLLLGELNCTSCHTPPGQASVAKKQAPILDAVASRVHPEFIREFLANPHSVKPGTTMPDLFAGVPEADKSRQIDAITHYLALTGTLGYAASNGQWAKKGEQLFHQVGCVACHDPRSAGSTPIPGSVPLGPLDKKYSIPSLRNFLSDPLAVRPSGRMPSLNLTQDEARDIASYLLGAQTMPANLNFSYYEGTWDKLPDFSQLKPKSTGKSSGFDLRVGRSDNFAMRFTGFLHVAKDGEYRFHLGSDDGSRLLVDGKQVVIMDGVHPPSWGNGAVKLTAGVHEVVVEFFEAGGGEELYVDYEGAGVARQSIEFALTLTKDPPQDAGGRKAFTVNPTLAEQGKKLFVEVGCAKCHQLGPQAPASQTELLAPPELARLKSSGGCLEAAPRRGVPNFGLSAAQRTALSAALEQQRGGAAAKAPTADESIQATMVQFNCIACHQRGMLGGVPEARSKFFVSNQPEMGDEGRIPPALAGAGAKLKAEWLKHLLD
ncbi:MAG TPA: c-type cytochrome, partial [Pirellulaceae bacterium]|nr:c-type cytochrome [Pirellulaceae bacterium]